MPSGYVNDTNELFTLCIDLVRPCLPCNMIGMPHDLTLRSLSTIEVCSRRYAESHTRPSDVSNHSRVSCHHYTNGHLPRAGPCAGSYRQLVFRWLSVRFLQPCSERKRHTEDDGFLGSHFSSGGKLGLGRGDAIRGATSPEGLKQALLSILQEGETVTR